MQKKKGSLTGKIIHTDKRKLKSTCRCALTLGWARIEASSCVHWFVFTLYSPLLEGRLRVAMTDIIFCKPVAVSDTVMDGADARARPIGHPRTVTGSWVFESCTEPRSLSTGLSGGASSSTRSLTSSSSASARDFSSAYHKKTYVIYSHTIIHL